MGLAILSLTFAASLLAGAHSGERVTRNTIRLYLKTAIANASHRLRFPRNADLVTTFKQGRFVMYALAAQFARPSSDGSLDALDFGCC
jgi:hypothetical protein